MPETCGKRPLRETISMPTARITPASATHTVSLSPEPMRRASSSDSRTIFAPAGA